MRAEKLQRSIRAPKAKQDSIAPGKPARSRVTQSRGFRWEGIQPEPYAVDPQLGSTDPAFGIRRQVLLAGSRGAAIAFDVRYFEIPPGGKTHDEQHQHAHVVIAMRGRGRVRIGRKWRELAPNDLCYIGPLVRHQLENPSRRPFGFLCLVDAKRDASVRHP